MDSVEITRYTLDGPTAVESRIAEDQRVIGAAVRRTLRSSDLAALILAGGYGRGEGGYRCVDDRYEPYNDYDYFVVTSGGRSAENRVATQLTRLAHELEEIVGVEVDFATLRRSRLSRLPNTLMNAELKHGHEVIVGDPDILSLMRPMPCDKVPLAEFSRLMLNRGSLLLMNARELASGGPKSPEDREQFSRYLDKALLACADARLAATGRYDPSYLIKRERLCALGWQGSRNFLRRYDRALKSRAGNTRLVQSGEESVAQATVVADWLEALAELETKRLGRLPAWSEYSTPGVAKGQSTSGPLGMARNLAVTVRDFGFGELIRNTPWALRYPRERLISVLPALLEPSLDVPKGTLSNALSQPESVDTTDLSEQFLRFWKRYN